MRKAFLLSILRIKKTLNHKSRLKLEEQLRLINKTKYINLKAVQNLELQGKSNVDG